MYFLFCIKFTLLVFVSCFFFCDYKIVVFIIIIKKVLCFKEKKIKLQIKEEIAINFLNFFEIYFSD